MAKPIALPDALLRIMTSPQADLPEKQDGINTLQGSQRKKAFSFYESVEIPVDLKPPSYDCAVTMDGFVMRRKINTGVTCTEWQACQAMQPIHIANMDIETAAATAKTNKSAFPADFTDCLPCLCHGIAAPWHVSACRIIAALSESIHFGVDESNQVDRLKAPEKIPASD